MSRPPSRASGRPTLAELARIAGVSPITASRVLRGVSTVDPELVRRVREAAEAIHYVANPAARALASARSSTVVVLVPSLSNLLFIETLEEIQAVLAGAGLEMFIGNTHYVPDEEERLVRDYLAYQPRGLILTGGDQTPATRAMLDGAGIPRVHMMDLAAGAGACCVGFSQIEAGAAVARHLLERGRRRLAWIAAQLDPRTLERGRGFRQALADGGHPDPVTERVTTERSSVFLGGQMFLDLLRTHPETDGIFFNNDDMALGALFEAQRLGIAIPGRVAIVGFNDLPISAHTAPRLTSVRTPRGEVGAVTARQLLRLMNGERISDTRIDLGFELIARESS